MEEFFTDWWVVLTLENGETWEGWGVGQTEDEIVLRVEPSQIHLGVQMDQVIKIDANKNPPA